MPSTLLSREVLFYFLQHPSGNYDQLYFIDQGFEDQAC